MVKCICKICRNTLETSHCNKYLICENCGNVHYIKRLEIDVEDVGRQKTTKFILLDLERSYGSNRVYWRANKRGYTMDMFEAGRYSFDDAINICTDDIMCNTLMLPEIDKDVMNKWTVSN